DRMVRAVSLSFAAIRDVHRGDPEVLDKRGIIRARPQSRDRQICPFSDFATIIRLSSHNPECAGAFNDRDLLLRIDYVAGHFVDELLERVGAAYREETAAITIRIDI